MMTRRRTRRKPRSADSSDALAIPDAELDVLACVWQEGPVTARRIREMLARHRPMAHGSVVTLLSRLEAKGMIGKEKGPVGKAFLFKSIERPEPTYRRLVKDWLGRVFGGNTAAMISAVLEVEAPTVEEYAEIQKAIAAARSRVKKATRRTR